MQLVLVIKQEQVYQVYLLVSFQLEQDKTKLILNQIFQLILIF